MGEEKWFDLFGKEDKKKIIVFLSLIVLIPILLHLSFVLSPKCSTADCWHYYFPRAEILRYSIDHYKDFNPLWNPFFMSGTVLYEYPQHMGYDNIYMYLVMMFNSVMAFKINLVIDVILAGLFMFLFMRSIEVKSEFAFISSLVYMLSGFVYRMFYESTLTSLNGYAFIPLVMLFAVMAVKRKEWILPSILTGVVFALQIRLGPDLKVFLFTIIMFGILNAFYFFASFPKLKFKLVANVIIVLIIVAGLSSQILLPKKEYLDLSSRSNLPYEQSATRALKIPNMFSQLVEPIKPIGIHSDGYGNHIGLIAASLACLALFWKRKSKFVLFLGITMIFILLIATGSFVFYLLWKYVPPFGGFRQLNRSLSVFVFCGAVLAGIGAQEMYRRYSDKFPKNKIKWAYIIVILAIFINLGILGYTSHTPLQVDVMDDLSKSELWQDVAKKPGIFRVAQQETNGIDNNINFITVPLGLEDIYGYESAWYPPYLNEFLSVSFYDRPKILGIMNVKYISSTKLLNDSGFVLIGEYDVCEDCINYNEIMKKRFGPYLYENPEFLPRVYILDNAFLVYGDKANVDNFVNFILANEFYQPRDSVIIKRYSDKDPISNGQELTKFKGIIIAQQKISDAEGKALEYYYKNGGKLVPDIFEGKQFSEKDIAILLNISEAYSPIPDSDVITHDFDHKEIKLNKQYKGKFLVLSEKYTIFPGWSAKADGKGLELMNANSMITTVYLDESYDSVKFTYLPKMYVIGSWISLITMILVICAIAFIIYDKRKKKGEEKKEQSKSDSPSSE